MRASGSAWATMSAAACRDSSLETKPLRMRAPSDRSTVTCNPASANCCSRRRVSAAFGESSDMVWTVPPRRPVQAACRWPGVTLPARMRRAAIVVGKAPIPGQTKTRLVPPLTPEDAAALYRGFLLDALHVALDLSWERTSVIHPRGHGSLLRLLIEDAELVEQPGDGLEHALTYAFERHFAEGYESVILIGSDNPTLGPEPIHQADAALREGADLAIGPTVDGGYYLIGMRQPRP